MEKCELQTKSADEKDCGVSYNSIRCMDGTMHINRTSRDKYRVIKKNEQFLTNLIFDDIIMNKILLVDEQITEKGEEDKTTETPRWRPDPYWGPSPYEGETETFKDKL